MKKMLKKITTFFNSKIGKKWKTFDNKKKSVIIIGSVTLVGTLIVLLSSAALPLLTSIEIEQTTLPVGASKVSDATASGGSAVKFSRNGTASGSFTIPSGTVASSLDLIARSDLCKNSGAYVSVVVDGTTVINNQNIASSKWIVAKGTLNLQPGVHTINFVASNIGRSGSCYRYLYLDVANIFGSTITEPIPTVSITANPSSVLSGGASTLSWDTTNATSCTASGSWSGTKATSGSASTGALTADSTFSLSCTGAGGSASASTRVTVTTTTASFTDNFSTYTKDSCYPEGATFGQWKHVYGGYGCTKVVASDGTTWLSEAPKSSSTTGETHASLVTGPSFSGPLTFNLKMKTVSQLRTGSTPNPWEAGWAIWNYTDNTHFYYVVLKPNGWEIGKADPAYTGAQRFLATGSSPTYAIGSTNSVSITQDASNTITLKVNGTSIATFQDTERPYSAGSIGLYNEDANALFTDISVTTPTVAPPTNDVTFSTQAGRSIPDMLYGVTTEDITNLSGLDQSLKLHKKRPTTRVVFQSGTQPSYYSSAVTTLRNNSYIMGQILDSSAMSGISVANYKTRATNFVSTFKNNVDIWEIGNELNGEWLGSPTDIIAKTQAAYDVVEKDYASLNLRSAITLNYWPSSDCYAYSWEDTTTFANSLPTEIKNGVDYVFLSFYETACSPRAYPTDADFTNILNKMKTIFPNSKVGMGEIGAQGRADGLASDPTLTEKQRIANRYYGMTNTLKTNLGPRYVGGGFWWYYYQDAVPYNKTDTLWPTLEQQFNSY